MTASQLAPIAGVGIIVLKSSLILVIGWGISRALRGAPAAARYAIWLSAIVGALLTPVVDRLAPINVTVLPAVSDSRASASSALANTASIELRDAQVPVADPQRPGPLEPRSRWPSVMQLVGALWTIVAFVMLARFTIGLITVRRLVRRARVIDSTDWTRILVEAARRIAVAATPRLVMSDQVETAFTFDALAPAIMLPSSAEEWPDARRRAVLLHELAHIRRHDLVGHVIGAVACALGWFNPFMWKAAGELRIESELASDEMVLAAGVRPSEYAQHLLDLVTSFGRSAPSAAVAIARPNELEGRLVAILDPRRRHAALTRRAAGAWATSFLLAAVCIGAVEPVSRARSVAPVAPPTPQTPTVDQPPVPMSAKQTSAPARARTSGDSPRRTAPPSVPATPVDTSPRSDTAAHLATQTVAPPVNRAASGVPTDSLFEMLFDGISLTDDQSIQAHALLVGLQAAQQAQTETAMKRRQEVAALFQPHLDSVLLALPANPADADTLRSRLTQAMPGDGLYARLFAGLAVSSEHEAAARAAILDFQQSVRALLPRPEPPILGVRRNPTRVMMRAASDSAFRTLVSSEADRATLKSRINVVIPPSRSPN